MSPSLVISCVSLFLALGSVGYSATGGTFRLGQANTANKTTALKSGAATGPALKVTHTANRPAAAFVSKSGTAPFTVNRTTKVAKLNADLFDDLDSLAFLRVGVAGVTSAEILDDNQVGGGLGSSDLATNSVAQAEIATDGVAATEIQDNSIDSGEIVDFQLSNQDIGVLFAEVSGAGVVDNSSGNVTVTKLAAAGQYEVDFARNITLCTAVATIGPAAGGSAVGEINVADRSGNTEAVFVDTNESSGTGADKPFRLIVVC
jgi:hypothetical protein